jgi:LysM repeat protein
MTIALKYTILAGDTLSGIAQGLSASSGVGYQAIAQANPGVNPNALTVGTVLNIPAPGSNAVVLRYTVMAGDSYSKIADELETCANMTYQAIEQVNRGLNPNTLSIGQVIAIPQTSNHPSPAPVEPVTPVAPVTPVDPQIAGEIVGFWWWTWSATSAATANTNLGIAFSGWTDPATALQNSAHIKNSLPGSKYIALGGGNSSGAFTHASLTSVTAAINAGSFAGYDGIAYDVEEGDSGLESLFEQSFAAAKDNGFKVLVTVSHSAPYGISDASTLMQSFFANANIDYLSPQLYTTGKETANQYATSGGVTWSEYATAKAAVVPSIVDASLYQSAQNYFQQQGVTLSGFIQWGQA